MNEAQGQEQRGEVRERRSEAIFWRNPDTGQEDMAWLLETSERGLAFIWRGETSLTVGNAALVCLDLKKGDRVPVIVRRVQRVHDDLVLIACERVPMTPAAAKQTPIVIRPISLLEDAGLHSA